MSVSPQNQTSGAHKSLNIINILPLIIVISGENGHGRTRTHVRPSVCSLICGLTVRVCEYLHVFASVRSSPRPICHQMEKQLRVSSCHCYCKTITPYMFTNMCSSVQTGTAEHNAEMQTCFLCKISTTQVRNLTHVTLWV